MKNYVYDSTNRMDKGIYDFIYNTILPFSEGLAPVRKSYNTTIESAYIDVTGKEMLDSKFSATFNFIDGYACVCDKETAPHIKPINYWKIGGNHSEKRLHSPLYA